jgi:hypothetical protein
VYTSGDVFVAETSDLTADSDFHVSGQVSGLSPSTSYLYKVKVGGVVSSWSGAFRTAPSLTSTAEIKLCTLSDTQYYDNGEDTVYYGRFSAVRALDPDFIVIQGDFPHDDVNNNNSLKRTRWEVALKDAETIAAFKQFGVARLFGDHDMAGDNSNGNSSGAGAARTLLRQVHPLPTTSEATNTSYFFDWGRLRVICIDERSQRFVTSGRFFSSTTLDWLKARLSEARARRQIVQLCGHVPWNSVSDSDTWYGDTTTRTAIMDYIKSIGMEKSVFFTHGDAHMLAYDTGATNGHYDTGATFGLPCICTASFNRGSSTKGGPWDHGTFAGTRQFGYLSIIPSDSKATVSFKLIKSDDSSWLEDSFDLEWPAVEPLHISSQSSVAAMDASAVYECTAQPVSSLSSNEPVTTGSVYNSTSESVSSASSTTQATAAQAGAIVPLAPSSSASIQAATISASYASAAGTISSQSSIPHASMSATYTVSSISISSQSSDILISASSYYDAISVDIKSTSSSNGPSISALYAVSSTGISSQPSVYEVTILQGYVVNADDIGSFSSTAETSISASYHAVISLISSYPFVSSPNTGDVTEVIPMAIYSQASVTIPMSSIVSTYYPGSVRAYIDADNLSCILDQSP